MVIAIDGPAGAGKGTIANELSKKIGFSNLDTGITYRCLALKCIKLNISENDKDKIIDLSKKINIFVDKNNNVFLDSENVTKEIRTHEVSMLSSIISSIIEVRKNMVSLQRKMADGCDVIVEGRDITTVVFPNADYKFYLDASIEERTRRRFNDDSTISFDELKDQIRKRDYNDMNKEYGALKRTNDQIYIDTTSMSINDVVNKIIEVIK